MQLILQIESVYGSECVVVELWRSGGFHVREEVSDFLVRGKIYTTTDNKQQEAVDVTKGSRGPHWDLCYY